MKGLLNKIGVIILVLLFTNCKDEKEYKKVINSNVLFSTQDKRSDMLSGSYFFYDKKGNLITDYLFINSNDSTLHYEMRVRNSHRQIVYFCEYKNGEILREFDSFVFDTISRTNGSFLYENYCKSCHYNENSIGPSLWSLSKISIDDFTKSYNSMISHDTIPKVTKKQLLSIYEFISKPSE